MKTRQNTVYGFFTAIAAIALSFALTALSLTGCDNGDNGTTTVPVSGVTLNKSALSLTVGGSETLSATVAPDNATNKAVTWTTSDPAKVTVVNGTVTAVAAGSATITVTTADGNKKDTCAVTVTDSAASKDWGEWEITTHATCTTEGKRIRTSIDGSAAQEEVIPVNPDAHDWKQISGTPATCEADGNGTRKCDRCGKEGSGVDFTPIDAQG